MTRKFLSRRTLLKGLGAAVGLPVLDAMTPAFADPKPERPRLGVVYAPNGMYMPAWTRAAGAGPDGLPSTLAPLEAFRHNFTVLNGIGLDKVDEATGAGAPHSLACTAFLTGHAPLSSEGELRAGVSIDQTAAKITQKDSWLPSIEFACEEQMSWMDREAE